MCFTDLSNLLIIGFRCFFTVILMEVYIDQVCCVCFALAASQSTTEWPYHSKLPVRFGAAWHRESCCSLDLLVPTECVQEPGAPSR